MDLDKKAGPFTFRIWFLVLNFIMNFIALLGAANYLRGDAGPILMAVGIIGTIVCIVILSKPQTD